LGARLTSKIEDNAHCHRTSGSGNDAAWIKTTIYKLVMAEIIKDGN
jgi:hypothetical protein